MDGIPLLLSHDPKYAGVHEIASAYDSFYHSTPGLWDSLGRDSLEFRTFFCSLLSQFQSSRLLEIGCGEGSLLANIRADEKFAVDISRQALAIARTRTRAQFSVALAERLPFPSDYFDIVVSLGVMEHFLDEADALKEIRRVLAPSGHYVTLIHVHLTLYERISMKLCEYLFPRPRPLRFVSWLQTRLATARCQDDNILVPQPIQKKYTTRTAKRGLERHGFRIVDVIHSRKYPSLPLKGRFVVIYVGEKPCEPLQA